MSKLNINLKISTTIAALILACITILVIVAFIRTHRSNVRYQSLPTMHMQQPTNAEAK